MTHDELKELIANDAGAKVEVRESTGCRGDTSGKSRERIRGRWSSIHQHGRLPRTHLFETTKQMY